MADGLAGRASGRPNRRRGTMLGVAAAVVIAGTVTVIAVVHNSGSGRSAATHPGSSTDARSASSSERPTHVSHTANPTNSAALALPGPDKTGGTLQVQEATAPDSLDPDVGFTTQASEGDNMVYTPLLTYAFAEGTAGTALIPGLASRLPTVSADRLTYTLQLRSDLTFSDGTPVVASDFTHAIERSIAMKWGYSSFFTGYIAGAAAYQDKKATTISGITTDDSSGAITIKLVTPYGAFENLLAFTAAAPIPASTPMTDESDHPPVGVGPYRFGVIVPSASYTLVKNPSFAGFDIPGIPAGFIDQVDVTVDRNSTTEAETVLNNTADVFDPGDTIPASVLARIPSQAKDRYLKEPLASVDFFFMNTQEKPFNNEQARLAVNMALDRPALAKLSGGQNVPACTFLPPTIVGHADGPCSFGDPNSSPTAATVAKAKSMIAAAGLANYPVTVWSETGSPRRQFGVYLNGLLNRLGFDSTLRVVADSEYFQAVRTAKNKAQIGFAYWSQDFPNPSDFYLVLSADELLLNSDNLGDVDDPHIESQLRTLDAVPAGDLPLSAVQWTTLDTYVTDHSYLAPFGNPTVPKFLSDKVDFNTAVFNPVNYLEYNTIAFKNS